MGEDSNLRCSIHHWADHGIAGRGVLLDYYHYAHTHNKPYHPYKAHEISFAELKACATSQGLDIRPESRGGDIRPGDVLFVRSGFVQEYYKLSPDERHAAATRKRPEFAGLSHEKLVRDWLHDCYFAAGVGDSPTFEVWPPPGFGPDHISLHQSMLSLWGCPIGEMWDLEKLAVKCRALGKWTFFMTSAPANMPGKFRCAQCGCTGNRLLTTSRWCWVTCKCDRYFVNGLVGPFVQFTWIVDHSSHVLSSPSDVLQFRCRFFSISSCFPLMTQASQEPLS